MALEPCPNCNHTISTLALACPMCGAPGEATRTPVVVAELGEAAPESVDPARPVATRRRLLDSGTVLLCLCGLAAAVLGAMADAGLHRLLAGGTRPSAERSANVPAAALAARRAQPTPVAVAGADSLQLRARQQEGEAALRAALADVAAREEAWIAGNHSYESSLDVLEYLPSPGVHVRLSAGPTWWSASAEHDSLPGFSCSRGAGAAFGAGKVTCGGRDTARAEGPQ